MKAIQITRYGQLLKFNSVKRPENLKSGEVLIKVHSAPINPSDIYFSKGVYGVRKPLPTIIGFEGSGTIVEKGPNVPSSVLSKNTAFWITESINSGSWGEYCVTDLKSCILLDNESTMISEKNVDNNNNTNTQQQSSTTQNLQNWACPFVNPITAMGFLDIAKAGKHNCVVLNAANSAVGRMSIRLFAQHNIKSIAIVRKDEQIADLKAIGASHVLNQSNKSFLEELQQTAKKEAGTCFFDAVGGEIAGGIFTALPDRSEMHSYGVFSLKTIDKIDPAHLVFRQKRIQGFWLTRWIEQKNERELEQIKLFVRNNLQGILETRISQVFKMQDINKALQYYMANSSKGKVLLQP